MKADHCDTAAAFSFGHCFADDRSNLCWCLKIELVGFIIFLYRPGIVKEKESASVIISLSAYRFPKAWLLLENWHDNGQEKYRNSRGTKWSMIGKSKFREVDDNLVRSERMLGSVCTYLDSLDRSACKNDVSENRWEHKEETGGDWL